MKGWGRLYRVQLEVSLSHMYNTPGLSPSTARGDWMRCHIPRIPGDEGVEAGGLETQGHPGHMVESWSGMGRAGSGTLLRYSVECEASVENEEVTDHVSGLSREMESGSQPGAESGKNTK